MNSFISFMKMIKLEHSIFALPFALSAMIMAANGIPKIWTIFWIIIAMVSARSMAMGLNRYADAEIDARNPRTAEREIPAGKLSKETTMLYIMSSAGIYFLSAFMLNKLTAVLSPVPILVFILYSYAKRFTNLCHIILGIALGLAPICAWVAVTGSFHPAPIIIGAGVTAWVAGFDILYAVQDIEFDRKEGLHSIPAYLGTGGAIITARILHIVAFILFFTASYVSTLGWIYLTGVALSGILMIYEHSLVSKNNLSKLNQAFFNMNAYISIILMIFTITDIMVGK